MNSIVSKEDFAQLVRQHAAAVIDFTARLLPDRREAEEVAQDAFVKAFRNLSSFRGESSLLTWVQRIAYHKAVDHLRQRRPYMVAIDEVPTLLEDEEMVMEREERILLIEEAVDRLTPDDQLLLHLFYYEDRPLRDIAYIMDVEPNTLSQRLHRIRKKLMVMIKQKENGQQ
ncbi:MAG: sigma-70 family RNA polymerase sigma factor [Prevotella sp.]|nr:sigma-70 family RNA polymerase sigma factor [Prevotella sp.]